MSPISSRLVDLSLIAMIVFGAATLAVRALSGQAPQAPAAAQAPPATALILGRVVDAGTNRPMPSVVVRISTGRAGAATATADDPTAALTNAQGEFLFRGLEAGTYALSSQASGYLPGVFGVTRPEGTPDSIALQPGARVSDVVIRMWRLAAINGRVLDEAGEPVVNVQVHPYRRATVAGRRQLLPVFRIIPGRTDDRGTYRISSLPPGEYAVVVRSITNTAPELTGTDAVRAAALAEVGLVAAPAAGGTRLGGWQMLAGSGLPGTMAGAIAPEPSSDGRLLVYPTTFHPGTVRASEASIVALKSGDDVAGIDLRLPLVPALRISGTVTAPGKLTSQFRLQLVPADSTIASSSTGEVATAAPMPDGRFAFLGVPAGQYVIKAAQFPTPIIERTTGSATVSTTVMGGGVVFAGGSAATAGPPRPSPDPTLWAEVPVTLGDRDLDDVAVTLRTGARMSGRLEFDNSAPRPTPDVLRRLYFSLDTVAGLPSGNIVGYVDAQGQLLSAEYPPGRYMFRMNPGTAGSDRLHRIPEGGWTLESVLINGRNVVDVPFDLGEQELRDIVVTYTTRTASIAGSVADRGRSGSAAAVVLLVPADIQTRMTSGARDRSEIVDVRPNGTFQINDLIAGDYLVVGLDAAAMPLDFQDASTVAAIMRTATRVTLGRGDSRTLSLTVSPLR